MLSNCGLVCFLAFVCAVLFPWKSFQWLFATESETFTIFQAQKLGVQNGRQRSKSTSSCPHLGAATPSKSTKESAELSHTPQPWLCHPLTPPHAHGRWGKGLCGARSHGPGGEMCGFFTFSPWRWAGGAVPYQDNLVWNIKRITCRDEWITRREGGVLLLGLMLMKLETCFSTVMLP